MFLDQWWTQAVVDATDDEDSREAALDFADLAVSLRTSAVGDRALSMAEVVDGDRIAVKVLTVGSAPLR